MENKIRVLGIAPYKGLQTMLQNQAANYPEIELHTVIGDLQQGLSIAKDIDSSDYDVIISRGGTATLLREKTHLPMVEVPVTFYDILRSIRLAEGIPGRKAIVGYSNITKNAALLCELLQLDISIYSIVEENEVDEILSKIHGENYSCILCDTVTSIAAKRLGILAILITAGSESIEEAFRNAITLHSQMERLRKENVFLQTVLDNHKAQAAIFSETGKLYYASPDTDKNMLKAMRETIPDVLDGSVTRQTRSFGGKLYSVKCSLIPCEGVKYIAFYYTSTGTPLSKAQTGISYYSRKQLEKEFLESFYAVTGDIENYRQLIARVNQQSGAFLITGEEGSGRRQLVYYIYINSSYSSYPLIEIDCELLSARAWDYLINSHNSPLYGSGDTIHIRNMEALAPERMTELLASFTYLDIASRNRLILSCLPMADGSVHSQIQRISSSMNAVKISLPPLRSKPEQIPALISLYLSNLNNDTFFDIIRVEPDAIDALQEYSWPGNYTQFKRILQALASTSSDHLIHANAVRQILNEERSISRNVFSEMNLQRPLAEIEEDIIAQVVRMNDGNQTASAKQLDISRTTLWRIYKRSMENRDRE